MCAPPGMQMGLWRASPDSSPQARFGRNSDFYRLGGHQAPGNDFCDTVWKRSPYNIHMQPTTTPNQRQTPRIVLIDAMRGFALVLMTAYHFCFDLAYYGFVNIDFNNTPFWLGARAFIVTLFLLLVGISLQLANAGGIRWSAVWRRLAVIGAAALTVTLASALLFPDSYIFFGILHLIALASLLALPLLRYRWLALATAVALLLLDLNFADPLFNQPALQWIGLMTYKPVTEDYVPLLPWFATVLLGVFFGSWLLQVKERFTHWRGDRGPWPTLRWAGRHSLLFYLLHQPILLGLLYPVTLLLAT